MTANDTCWVAIDRLECLREVSFDPINAAPNTTSPRLWFPVIDGDVSSEQLSRSLYVKKYVKVPIIIGAVTDEGAFYMPSKEIRINEEFEDLIASKTPTRAYLPSIAIY